MVCSMEGSQLLYILVAHLAKPSTRSILGRFRGLDYRNRASARVP